MNKHYSKNFILSSIINCSQENKKQFPKVMLSVSFSDYLISYSFYELIDQCEIMTYKRTLYANKFTVLTSLSCLCTTKAAIFDTAQKLH